MNMIRKLPAVLFTIPVLFTAAPVFADTTIILPFYVSGVEAQQSAKLGKLLLEAGKEKIGINNIRAAGNVSAIENFDPENSGHLRA
ncbi:MAG TPA: hypothetical protein PK200_01565, partial [Spirochaetota bacterium]|nr:hypothetical protein [Spirochaetota bacterium]